MYFPLSQVHKGGILGDSAISVSTPEPVTCLTLSSDSITLAAAAGSKLYFYHIPSLVHKKSTKPINVVDCSSLVLTAAFSNKSKNIIAAAIKDKPAKCIDIQTGKTVDTSVTATYGSLFLVCCFLHI